MRRYCRWKEKSGEEAKKEAKKWIEGKKVNLCSQKRVLKFRRSEFFWKGLWFFYLVKSEGILTADPF
jgi:hypothetical protein